MQWTKTPATQRGAAFIMDNRNGSIERIGGIGISIKHANQSAYQLAADECTERNGREGWARFVAMTQQAAEAAGIVSRFWASPINLSGYSAKASAESAG